MSIPSPPPNLTLSQQTKHSNKLQICFQEVHSKCFYSPLSLQPVQRFQNDTQRIISVQKGISVLNSTELNDAPRLLKITVRWPCKTGCDTWPAPQTLGRVTTRRDLQTYFGHD